MIRWRARALRLLLLVGIPLVAAVVGLVIWQQGGRYVSTENAASLNAELAKLKFKPQAILASFHGVPEAYVEKGDPYAQHCAETTRLLRQKLKMDDELLVMTFQSRFGKAEWIKPYTDATVQRLAKEGVKNLAVITPGFAADCLETLEEIAMENAEIFRHAGGENFAAIPCLNDSPGGMTVIRDIVSRELKGWI